MGLKLETQENFYGFAGNSHANGEYYFSQNMTRSREGIKPFWEVEVGDSYTTTGNTRGLIKWMDEKAGTIWGYDSLGNILSGSGAAGFSVISTVSVANSGNGLIVVQNGSIFYTSNQYLGYSDGSTFNDTWKDFGLTEAPRPMGIWQEWVVITGSYMSSTSVAEQCIDTYNIVNDLYTSIHLRLPPNSDVKSIQGGTNGVLIAFNTNNQGNLWLWDCLNDGYLSSIPITGKVESVCKDGNGQWIVMSGNEIFSTNGYSKQLLANLPDNLIQSISALDGAQCMQAKDWYVFIGGGEGANNRRKKGIWILDLRTKLWEFTPISNNCSVNINIGAIFIDSTYRINLSYKSTTPDTTFDGVLKNDIPSQSFLMTNPIGRGNNYKVAEGLYLDIDWDLYQLTTGTPNWSIEAGIYDYSRQFWNTCVTNDISSVSTNLHVNGTLTSTNIASVGDMVMVLEGTNAGQIAFISSITGQDTATETWGLDRALTGNTEFNTQIDLFPIKKIGTTWNITANALTQKYWPIEQTPRAKKFMIFLYFSSGVVPTQCPALASLSLAYNDLGIL